MRRIQPLTSPYSCESSVHKVIQRLTSVPTRVVEQPLKIPFVASVYLLGNIQKPELTGDILLRASTSIQEWLEQGSWREVKLGLRFLACLQGVLNEDGVFPILDELFSRAVDLQTASSEDVSETLVPEFLSCYLQSLHRHSVSSL